MLYPRPGRVQRNMREVFFVDNTTTVVIVIAVIAVVAVAGYFLYKKFKANK